MMTNKRRIWSRLGLALAIATLLLGVDPPEPARAAPLSAAMPCPSAAFSNSRTAPASLPNSSGSRLPKVSLTIPPPCRK